MLNKFDWLRRSRNGAELMATLLHFQRGAELISDEQELGSPFTALHSPCQRCHIYSASSGTNRLRLYCSFCEKILKTAGRLGRLARQASVIWGYVPQLPKQMGEGVWLQGRRVLGIYVHDDDRFLLMMQQRELRPWLQELVLYHGASIHGLFQIFPSMGRGQQIGMGDILCWAVHREAGLMLDRLRVQFYSAPYQLINSRDRDRKGLLTYEVSEFLRLLEMAEVFRAQLRPFEQKQLHELLNLRDPKEEQFYWGRFLGNLSQEAKDMLSAWRIRQWPENQVKLLYELINYVTLPDTR